MIPLSKIKPIAEPCDKQGLTTRAKHDELKHPKILMMNEPTIKDGFIELGIFEKDKNAWTSSRELSRVFEKEHKDVIRQIRATIEQCEHGFGQRNFTPSSYFNSQNKKQPEFLMTRKGFSLVAMGFTGEKAMGFKVAYIEAFENMLQLIETRILSKEGYKEMCSAIAHNLGLSNHLFAEEANMVNKVVLGMTSKDFREANGLKHGETPRDILVKDRLIQLDSAQRLNAKLIVADIHFDERKRILETNFFVGGNE